MLRREDSSSEDSQQPLEPNEAEKLDVVLPQLGGGKPDSLGTVDAEEEVEDSVLDRLGVLDSSGAPGQDVIVEG